MRSIQNLYDRGDWVGERGLEFVLFESLRIRVLCLPLKGLSRLGGADICDPRWWNRWCPWM